MFLLIIVQLLQIVWGHVGMNDDKHSSGVIVGGTDNGLVCVWDASKLIMKEKDAQILRLSKHSGYVGALDFNKFQVTFSNLSHMCAVY